MSWKELEGKKPSAAQVNKAVKERQSAFFHLFTSELGQKVLGYMEEEAMFRPELPGSAVDGAALNVHLAVRAGERSFYRWIGAQITKGQPHHEKK